MTEELRETGWGDYEICSGRPLLTEVPKVTICIAAACQSEVADTGVSYAIVLCTDLKTSGPLGSAETALKQRILKKGWYALTSGTESEIMALDPLLGQSFRAAEEIDETNICKIISDALLARKQQKATEFIIGKLGISYDEFLKTGKDRLPAEIFRDFISQVADMKLPEFVIAGFDDDFPLVCQTSSNGIVSIREDFAIAGEGGYIATSVLLQRDQQSVSNLNDTLYHVYEAKKYSEKVPSVGERTRLSILTSKGIRRVTTSGRRWLEDRYKEFGPQKINSRKLKLPDGFSVEGP